MLVYVIEARYLHKPTNVVRVKLMIDDPSGQFVPFVFISTIDTDAPFAILSK